MEQKKDWFGLRVEMGKYDDFPSELAMAQDPLDADIIVPFEPAEGERLYFLSLRRTTGDSFSSHSGIFTPLAAYRSEAMALRAQAAVKSHAERSGGRWSSSPLAIPAEEGQLLEMHAQWVGYFESIDDISVRSLPVIGARGKSRRR